MPGKQMAIDADLSSGLINEQEARARRQKIQKEADFYGAMDGATKIVKGDAVMSIVITLINFVGGVIIGMVMGGGDFATVLQTYSLCLLYTSPSLSLCLSLPLNLLHGPGRRTWSAWLSLCCGA